MSKPINLINRSFRYTYVWLLMKGDNYLPGIYISVYSVIRTKSPHDLVVMVTDDVSQNAIKTIMNLQKFTKQKLSIALIDYLEFDSIVLSEGHEKIYSAWKNISYTKWQMLNLPHDKALLIDADAFVTRNIDNLFDLTCPAGPFNSPYAVPFGFVYNYIAEKMEKEDSYLPHGVLIPHANVDNALKHGVVLVASTILLEPSKKDFNDLIYGAVRL